MSDRQKKYRNLGVVYVIIGILSLAYFLSNELFRHWLFGVHNYVMFFGYFLMFIVPSFMLVSSFCLALFGLVLGVRGGVWIARISGVLCCISLGSNFYLMIMNLLRPESC